MEQGSNISIADEVALLCYNHFDKLPKKGKPVQDKEWTILAAVVQQIANVSQTNGSFSVVAMGTGSKCVGQNKLSKNGDLLNDSHAEIMARRGFLRYIYHQIELAITGKKSDIFDLELSTRKLQQKKEVSFIFFSSHTPCGDASIIVKENNVEFKFHEELQPSLTSERTSSYEPPSKLLKLDVLDVHRTGAKCVEGELQDSREPGVNHHVLGVLRTKPGRGDRTLSMSCSDKFAKWNILGIQGSLLMNFLLRPIYISHFIIGNCPFSYTAMERALISRFQNTIHLVENLTFKQQNPVISQSKLGFKFRKIEGSQLQPCPSSIVWCACPVKQIEVAVEGRKQGVTAKNHDKPACRLEICKKNLFLKFVSLAQIPQVVPPKHLKDSPLDVKTLTYIQAKRIPIEYFEMWKKLRANVFLNWSIKQEYLIEFTSNE